MTTCISNWFYAVGQILLTFSGRAIISIYLLTYLLTVYEERAVSLQLEETQSVTDEFFDLPDTIKLRYEYGDENHGWVAMEQER